MSENIAHAFLAPGCQVCVPLSYKWDGYEKVLIASYERNVRSLKDWYRNCELSVKIFGEDGDYAQYNLVKGSPGEEKTYFEVLFVDVKNETVVDDSSSYLAAHQEFIAVTKPSTQALVVLFVCDPPKERKQTWN